ncbi:MAG TPA: hypothetical protein PLH27_06140 [bacterium]|nr:hypothetical protein [bacterium]HMW32932.1 hypothetical protein [bacterium]HMW36424.1 hypothetical protein [bacterium]HMY36181.1 hypothetical protein [bacterium]HNB10580.1 hypothetical protein [bacterium]
MKTIRMISVFLLAGIGGCGDDTTALNDPWEAFAEGRYQDAHSLFLDLIETKPSEAYAGLGWTTLKMNADSLNAANRYFSLSSNDSLVYAFAGWALASWASENYMDCIKYGDFVLRKNPEFVFDYLQTLTQKQIALAQAYSYFHLQNLSACISKIRIIEPSYTPVNNLDRNEIQLKLDQLRQTQ